MIGAGGIHQKQGMPRRRRIKDHERTPRLLHDPRKGVEYGDLLGAGRTQILAQQGLPLGVESVTALFHYFADVAFGLRLRIDPVDP